MSSRLTLSPNMMTMVTWHRIQRLMSPNEGTTVLDTHGNPEEAPGTSLEIDPPKEIGERNENEVTAGCPYWIAESDTRST